MVSAKFEEELSNPRIKLTACGTLTHGKKRRLPHAAAYPHRYKDIVFSKNPEEKVAIGTAD